jgi:APA family basic amino acid/polyamine antiporter
VILKVVVIIFIIVGWQFIDPANYVPYIPENTGVKGQFDGLELQQEQEQCFALLVLMRFRLQLKKQNPKRYAYWNLRVSSDLYDLYVLFAHVMTGFVPYSVFANDAKPAATAFAVVTTSSNRINCGLF